VKIKISFSETLDQLSFSSLQNRWI